MNTHSQVDMPCTNLTVAGKNASCAELKHCLDVAISDGRLPPPSGTGEALVNEQTIGASAYFAIFYFFYFFNGVSATQASTLNPHPRPLTPPPRPLTL